MRAVIMRKTPSHSTALFLQPKYVIHILLFLACIKLESQSVNYCDYFSLKVDVTEQNGKQYFSYFIEVNDAATGKFAAFARRHENRFTYLFVNQFDDLGQLAGLYPDTEAIDSLFCQKLLYLDAKEEYFRNLSPGKLVEWTSNPAVYTIDEMMMVASRFFHAEQIDQTDTTIISRICVGIHGLGGMEKQQDHTLLEAFVFEAIFYNLLKNKSPRFEKNFDDCIAESLAAHKKRFVSYDSLLEEVRNSCYANMAKDEHLKKMILSYYIKNRNTLNFKITKSSK